MSELDRKVTLQEALRMQQNLVWLEAFGKESPERFKRFNPDNRWGTYEELVNFVQEYLNACRQWPEAEVRVSR